MPRVPLLPGWYDRPMTGSCFCGAVRYRVEGPPIQVEHCHCLHCRRTSGAAFVTWAVFAVSRYDIVEGTPREYEPRSGVVRTCCSSCGSQLSWQQRDAETIDVTVGTLDEPETLSPGWHVWDSRRLPWVKLDDDLPRYSERRK